MQTIRRTVFIEEQNVPEALELDGLDGTCMHVIAHDREGHPIGCARLLAHDGIGHIGRMAVLSAWRGKKVGSALLVLMMKEARRAGFTQVILNAQEHAIPFYVRHGFTAFGESFEDAGIPHRAMERSLT